jgi:ATP-dependent Zn protease
MGWGGKSLLWGPVASSIVWGLLFSTVLTLYIVPLFYLIFMRRSHLASGRNDDIADRQPEREAALATERS